MNLPFARPSLLLISVCLTLANFGCGQKGPLKEPEPARESDKTSEALSR